MSQGIKAAPRNWKRPGRRLFPTASRRKRSSANTLILVHRAYPRPLTYKTIREWSRVLLSHLIVLTCYSSNSKLIQLISASSYNDLLVSEHGLFSASSPHMAIPTRLEQKLCVHIPQGCCQKIIEKMLFSYVQFRFLRGSTLLVMPRQATAPPELSGLRWEAEKIVCAQDGRNWHHKKRGERTAASFHQLQTCEDSSLKDHFHPLWLRTWHQIWRLVDAQLWLLINRLCFQWVGP